MDKRLASAVRKTQESEGVQVLSVRIKDAQADQLMRAARDLHCTRSDVIRGALYLALEEEGA